MIDNNQDFFKAYAKLMAKNKVRLGVSNTSSEHITYRTEKLGFFTDKNKELERDAQNYLLNLNRW